MEFSIPALATKLRTEADAYLFLEDLRWNGKPTCPHCKSERPPYFLAPRNGASRKTRTGSETERRVWKCASCRRQFSVLTGTVFHGSKIPVRTWIFLVFEMCASKNGVAAREVERKYGLTPKTAWFALHRIREAMKREPLVGLLTGRVVADEAWLGGKPSNRHGYKRGEGRAASGMTDKTPIVALVSRETGEVRSRAVPNLRGSGLRSFLDEHVDPRTTHLHTDAAHVFKGIGRDYAGHSFVDHQAGEYVRGDVSTNQAETYFSQLKRSLDGTHHHVSVEHLPRYLAEFDYRFSTCKISDTERMQMLGRKLGERRLLYKPANERPPRRPR